MDLCCVIAFHMTSNSGHLRPTLNFAFQRPLYQPLGGERCAYIRFKGYRDPPCSLRLRRDFAVGVSMSLAIEAGCTHASDPEQRFREQQCHSGNVVGYAEPSIWMLIYDTVAGVRAVKQTFVLRSRNIWKLVRSAPPNIDRFHALL